MQDFSIGVLFSGPFNTLEYKHTLIFFLRTPPEQLVLFPVPPDHPHQSMGEQESSNFTGKQMS